MQLSIRMGILAEKKAKTMATVTFKGQSYKWPAWEVVFPGDVQHEVKGVRLSKNQAGNLTRLIVAEGGNWHGLSVSYSGTIKVSEQSRGDTVLAIASSGGWSGGDNWSGFIFGKPGAIVFFNCKGNKKWLVFDEIGCHFETVKPGSQATEL